MSYVINQNRSPHAPWDVNKVHIIWCTWNIKTKRDELRASGRHERATVVEPIHGKTYLLASFGIADSTVQTT
jgi:hypothetical protein